MPQAPTKITAVKAPPPNHTVAPAARFPFNFRPYIWLALIALLVNVNTLRNGFVLDDSSVVTQNTIVTKGITALPEIFATPYRRGYFVTSNDLYRPLSLALLATEYQFFEKAPLPYHFINILLYAACVILLFLFLDALFDQKRTTAVFITCLFFALHPIHTEVVANVKSQDELLCFLFAFLSLYVFTKYVREHKVSQLVTGAICYFLSLLAKETSITFLLVIPLIFFFYRNEHKKRSLYITLSALAAAMIFLVIRFSVLTAYHANETTALYFSDNALSASWLSPESRMATAVLVLGYYIKLLFVPWPLSCDYSYSAIPFAHFSDPAVLISLIVYIALIIFSIILLLQGRKSPYAFGILFFLITLSLFSNILFLIGSEMGERFLFFSSVGFCLVAGFLVAHFMGNETTPLLKNKKILALIIPVSLIYAALTINRNSDWTDNSTLYSTDLKKYPTAIKLNFSMAVELEKSIDEAKGAEQKQIVQTVIQYLNTALAGDPNYGDAVNNLAEIYFFDEKYEQAVRLFKKKIVLTPDFVNAYANIGACFGSMGKYDSALYYLNRAITIDPDYKGTYAVLVPLYKAMGNADSARKYEAIAQKINTAGR